MLWWCAYTYKIFVLYNWEQTREAAENLEASVTAKLPRTDYVFTYAFALYIHMAMTNNWNKLWCLTPLSCTSACGGPCKERLRINFDHVGFLTALIKHSNKCFCIPPSSELSRHCVRLPWVPVMGTADSCRRSFVNVRTVVFPCERTMPGLNKNSEPASRPCCRFWSCMIWMLELEVHMHRSSA